MPCMTNAATHFNENRIRHNIRDAFTWGGDRKDAVYDRIMI